MKEKEKIISARLEVDFDTMKVIGNQNNEPPCNEFSSEINIRIANSIKESIHKLAISWINDFVNKIKENNISQAFAIFKQNKSLLFFTKDSNILNEILKLDTA